METQPPEISPQITPEALRRALRVWDSTRQLGEQPLVGLQIVARQRLAAGYSATPAGWGLALRETLLMAVQALKPPTGEFDAADKRWRPYFILNEQYIQNRAPEWVADQLYISRRTYYNEQEAALESLAEFLRQREGLDKTRPSVTDREPENTVEAEPKIPFLAPPRSIHALVGRQDVYQNLKAQLLGGVSQFPLAIFGLPGVGKSSLAIELAHDPQVLSSFSDGVLWVGLGRQPDLPAQLSSWATALGLPPNTVKPGDLMTSARALHAAIGMRRLLLIIDDAWEIETGLVFRLGGPNCATLLTTRLSSVAFDFAGQGAIRLQELDSEQGLNLLAQAAPQAIATDLEMANSLVSAVGGLPLALVLIGRHLRRLGQATQTRRLREALERLNQAEMRLQLTQPQSPLEQRPDLPAHTPCSLQTIIGLSDSALTAEAQQCLRALAHFPPKPNTFSEAAALAVSGKNLDILDTLIDSGLVECVPPERYTLHQTISDYVRLQNPDQAACQRYTAYFADFAAQQAANYPMLDLELNNLLSALDLADRCHRPIELLQTCLALHPFLLSRGFYGLDEQQLQRAAAYAHKDNNLASLAQTFGPLGLIKIRLGQYPEAQTLLEEGLTLARQLDLKLVEAECLQSLGNVFYYTGEYSQSRQHLQQALALYSQFDQGGEARVLNSLGLVAYEQAFHEEAKAYLEQALQINRSKDDRENQGINLSNLGLILADQGDYTLAVSYHQQALQICREKGNLRLEANILDNLSFALSQLGQLSEAKACYERALRIFRQIGNQPGIATVLAFLGSLLQILGDSAAALEYAQQALDLATTLKEPYTRGVALTVQGRALTELERPDEAVEVYQQAVRLWQETDQFHLATEPLAGLAVLACSRGDLETANQHINRILAHLDGNNLDGTLDPYWTYLTCCKVLQASQDARASKILEQAQAVLMRQAAKIADDDLRRSFLEKVSTHAEILELYRAAQGEPITTPHPGGRRWSL